MIGSSRAAAVQPKGNQQSTEDEVDIPVLLQVGDICQHHIRNFDFLSCQRPGGCVSLTWTASTS